MEIDSAKTLDIENIVRIHKSTFTESLFGSLSFKFLKKFYAEIFSSGEMHFLKASISGKTVGFIASYNLINLRVLKIFFYSFFRPRFWNSLIINLYVRIFLLLNQSKLHNHVEISVLAVLPNFQGMGVGKNLIKSLSKIYPNRNLYVVTDTKKSSDFYIKCEFEKLTEWHVFGQVRYLLKRNLRISDFNCS